MKRAVTSGKRLNHEPPAVTAKLGWRYHHIGIPHTQPRAREHHVAHLGVHVSGFETSPYGIEWIRFEPHGHVPEIVRIVPHVAFAVDDLDEALKGREILIAPTEPSVGVRVAFILDDGAPVVMPCPAELLLVASSYRHGRAIVFRSTVAGYRSRRLAPGAHRRTVGPHAFRHLSGIFNAVVSRNHDRHLSTDSNGKL